MPVHDWGRVPPRLFHPFHQKWASALADVLNDGVLPEGYYALMNLRTGRYEGDVIGLSDERPGSGGPAPGLSESGLPATRFRTTPAEAEVLAERADRLDVFGEGDRLVAVVELISPGNKHSRRALASFVGKALAMLNSGVHLLVVDLLPPTRRDPHGMHRAIWDAVVDDDPEPYAPPAGEPLACSSYFAGPPPQAFIEPLAVGAALPDMPLFLDRGGYVSVPLECSYERAWHSCPPPFRRRVMGER